MKKILLMSTGGTIASKQGEAGLEPQFKAGDLLGYVDELHSRFEFEYKDILQLDSSNIQPEQWQTIAKNIYENLEKYDGIVVTHGTDTMAYTASAVSYMLGNLNKSVVFTGSQLPIDEPTSDAKSNLITAVCAVESGIKGVTVAFNRKIINGTRAVKVSTLGFDAFESVNAPYMGELFADGMRINAKSTGSFQQDKPTVLKTDLCTDVFLLKLLPGTKPEIFDSLVQLGYRGIIIEAFGIGGIHYIQRDLLNKVNEMKQKGIVVVVCSQCLYERSDLSVYEVGQRLMNQGVISGWDMTTEAVSTKLMWALGQTDNTDEIIKMFTTSYAGEITL